MLARIIPDGSLEQIIFRVDALHWIEDRGIPCVNSPRAIERSVDKFYTTALLREAGLPVPETVVCERADEALAAIQQMAVMSFEAHFRLAGAWHGARQRPGSRPARDRIARADPRRVLRATCGRP